MTDQTDIKPTDQAAPSGDKTTSKVNTTTQNTAVPIKTSSNTNSAGQTPSTPSIPVPPGPSATSEAPVTESLISETAADSTPSSTQPSTSVPTSPVVVSDKDVTNSDGDTGKLAEEIEVLTGEIQALEAKIEQLSNGATAPTDAAPASPPSGDVAPINQVNQDEPSPAPVPSPPGLSPVMPLSPEPSSSGNEKEFVNKPTGIQTPQAGKVTDISPKAPIKQPEPTLSGGPSTDSSSEGVMSIIAEVVAVFGLIIFVILAISPIFREVLGEETFIAIQQIGWLATLAALGLGLILMLFVHGKGLFKFLLFLLLLLTGVIFLALNNNSLLSPISSVIDPLINFYR